MSQSDFGTINAATKSGPVLATDLNNWRSAVHSGHSGSSRPSYVVAGMTWLDTTGDPAIWKYYDGADDIVVGYLHATSNLFMLSDEVRVVDAADPTKRARFDVGGVTGGQTRVVTLPDANLDFSGLSTQAEGDILYRGGTAWQRLAKGTAGQVLRVNSGATAPEWATSWEPIGTLQTFSSTTSVIWTDLSAYMFLRLILRAVPATDASSIGLHASVDNGSNWLTGGSDYTYQIINGSDTTIAGGASTATSMILHSTSLGNLAAEGLFATVELSNFNKAAVAVGQSEFASRDTSGNVQAGKIGLWANGTSARNALRLIASSGALASGAVQLWGLRG